MAVGPGHAYRGLGVTATQQHPRADDQHAVAQDQRGEVRAAADRDHHDGGRDGDYRTGDLEARVRGDPVEAVERALLDGVDGEHGGEHAHGDGVGRRQVEQRARARPHDGAQHHGGADAGPAEQLMHGAGGAGVALAAVERDELRRRAGQAAGQEQARRRGHTDERADQRHRRACRSPGPPANVHQPGEAQRHQARPSTAGRPAPPGAGRPAISRGPGQTRRRGY